MNKCLSYQELIEVCKYQSIFLDRLGMFYVKLKQEELFTSEEMSKIHTLIDGILKDMYQNDKFITHVIEEIQEVDLSFEEKLGYPIVNRLLEHLKG